MKKIIFLIAGIMLTINCFAQQKVSINNIITTELPKDVKSVTTEQALTHAKKKFKDSKIASISISSTNKARQIYQLDDVIMIIVTDDRQAKEGHLNQIKKGLDEFFKDDLTYKSYISNINGNKFLITNTLAQGVGMYDFYCYTDNSQSATGSVIYNPVDSAKATAALDQILQNLKFKVQ